MKRITLLFIFVLGAAALTQAEERWSFKGTVIKMRMAECQGHGFMAAMSGAPEPVKNCPEYTVMTDKVVYVVVGKRTEEFMPLAENMDFLVRKNELVIFSGDEKATSHFAIQQMALRGDWEREQAHKAFAEASREFAVK
jgi:hypothetical protein